MSLYLLLLASAVVRRSAVDEYARIHSSPEDDDLLVGAPLRRADSGIFHTSPADRNDPRVVRSTTDLTLGRVDPRPLDRREMLRAELAAQALEDLEQNQDPRKCHAGAIGSPEPEGFSDDSEPELPSFAELAEEGRVEADLEMQHYRCSRARWRTYKDKFSQGGDPKSSSTRHFYNVSLAECRDSQTNVLWLYPTHDHNGAFDVDGSVCGRLLGWYEEACSVHVWRVATVAKAKAVLSAYPDNSLMQVTLGGHGADDEPEMQWGSSEQCGKGVLCGKNSPASRSFLRNVLRKKVARHASILLDSCYGQASGLAKYIADQVGKGVKVIGADNSFGAVTVGRFGPGYEVTGMEGANVVEILADAGRKCPRGYDDPDEDGDCECPRGKKCGTEDGEECPCSDGRFSKSHFDPGCTTYGTCKCE